MSSIAPVCPTSAWSFCTCDSTSAAVDDFTLKIPKTHLLLLWIISPGYCTIQPKTCFCNHKDGPLLISGLLFTIWYIWYSHTPFLYSSTPVYCNHLYPVFHYESGFFLMSFQGPFFCPRLGLVY